MSNKYLTQCHPYQEYRFIHKNGPFFGFSIEKHRLAAKSSRISNLFLIKKTENRHLRR